MAPILERLRYAISDSWNYAVTLPWLMKLFARSTLTETSPINRVSRRSDLRERAVIRAWEDFVSRQAREPELVQIDPASCPASELDRIAGWYYSRGTHRRSRWMPDRRGRTRAYDGEMVWDAAWVLAHTKVSRGQKMLDVGGENSFVPMYFACLGVEVDVVDVWQGGYGEEFVNNVLQHCLDGIFVIRVRGDDGGWTPVRYHNQDATRLPYPDNTFDRVLCLSVIEHIVDDRTAMREMARVLKPGGLLALSTVFGPRWQQLSDQPHHKTPEGTWTGDLERVYDEASLFSRLIEPSGLQLVGSCDFEVDWVQLRRYQMPGARSDSPSAAIFLAK